MISTKKTLLLIAALFWVSGPLHAQESGTNMEPRITALEDEIRTLNGKIEQLEYTIKRNETAMQRMQADLDLRLAKLETPASQLPQPTTVPVKLPTTTMPPLTRDDPPPVVIPAPPVNGTLGSLKMNGGVITGGAINPVAPPLPAAPPDYGLTPQEQYDRAFGLLKQADYDNAEKAFKTFIDKNPKDKLLDNAKYWYGETLYVRGRFNESAVAFAEAYQQNPQGSKAPDSLLKLAMSLENIDKVTDACTTLIELKTKYPNAPVNIKNRADEERAKMRCGH